MKHFIKGVFMDCNQPSFSRVSSAGVITLVLILITYLTLKDGKLPDLAGITLFTTGVVGITYGSNKIANAIEGKQ